MVSKSTWSILFLMGCSLACVAMVMADKHGGRRVTSGAVSFKPVAPVESLMHGQKTFFKRITKGLKKESGVKRNKGIKEAAEILAELANVNRFNKDKEDYRTWATQLRDTALEIAAEAKKKNAADEARLKTLYQKLKDTCSTCHDVYQ